jgi:L-alanine-DL-glutamate epimerase-like enolase superfamily enzyme
MARITKIRIVPLTVPYVAPISISLGTISEARNVIVRLYTDSGAEGVGEASPFVFEYSKETQESIVEFLNHIAPELLQMDPFDIEKIHEIMDRTPGGTCAKSAVDVALYDLMGKILGLPVYQLIGGQVRESIPLWYAVSWDRGFECMAQEAEKWVNLGFKGIMVKIGNGIEEDEQALRLVRSRVGGDVPIIADPNQAYSTSDAIELAERTAGYIDALEGPVEGSNIAGLKSVKDLRLVPVIADESLFSSPDAVTLVREQAADMFLIKLLKVGGFHKAREIFSVARAAGIRCCAASMTSLGIGHLANLHFATAFPLFEGFGFGFENLFQIFGTAQGIRERDVCVTPPLKDGHFRVPDGPGLGCTLIESQINRYAVEEILHE